jgi:hypothetical protein
MIILKHSVQVKCDKLNLIVQVNASKREIIIIKMNMMRIFLIKKINLRQNKRGN